MIRQYDRGALLFEQGRYEEAIKAFKEILAQDPENPHALMYIGWSYLIRENYSEALEYCEMAYRINPQDELIAGNYAQALFRKNQRNEALEVLNEAIRAFPYSYFLFYLKAQVHFFKAEYQEAESAIMMALEIEPESTDLLNLYHQILIKLKKKTEANAVMDFVLRESPQDSYSHANVGWSHIQHQDSKKARESFLEALRLNPDNEYAKEGLKEAIRIENPFYRTIHKFFLWMDKMSSGRQTAIIFGLFLLYQVIVRIADNHPSLNIILQPLILLYIVFALSSWVARPFSNFFLQFNRIGKHILSRDERIGANLAGGSFVLAIFSLASLLFVDNGWLVVTYVVGLIASITFSGAFLFHYKSPYRKLLYLVSFSLIGLALYGLFGGEENAGFLTTAAIGVLLYTIFIPFLARREAGMFFDK